MDEPLAMKRRAFVALVGASSVGLAGCSSSDRDGDRTHMDGQQTDLDEVYRIAPGYRLGPQHKRPPAGKAAGTLWEVTDGATGTRRTLSDGEHWVRLAQSQHPPGEYHLTPSDGMAGIQDVIDRTEGNVVIRLAPGTYTGSELTLAHGVLLVGSGRNATTLELADGANTDLLTTPNPPRWNVMECTLRDISLDGNRENNDTGNVVYGAFWNSRFIDCEFRSAPENGFWLAGSEASTDDNQFRGCQFIENGAAGLKGGGNRKSYPAVGVVRVDTNWFGHNDGPAITARGNSWKVGASKFYDNALDDGATIELDRCSYSSITGCDIYSALPARDLVAVSASKGVESIGNQVKNNDFRGAYRAAVGARTADSDVVALQVHGNTVHSDGNAVGGIVARAEDGSFESCSATNNTFVGAIDGRKLALPESWAVRGNVNAD